MKKRIVKIEKGDTLHHQQMQQQQLLLNNGKIMQRKKKGRLYSLGGNEPARKPRGRLDRLKTVGTFDLGTEMSVLSEVARNLNEKIISGDIIDGAATNRRLSTIMAVSSNLQDLSELSTPSSGKSARRDTVAAMPAKRNPCYRNSSADQFKSDLNNTTKTTTLNRNSCAIMAVSSVRTQHSADDCLEKQRKSSNNKIRSLSSSSYMTNRCGAAAFGGSVTANVDLGDIEANNSNNRVLDTMDSGDFKDKNSTNIVNISIKDSNKISTNAREESGAAASKDREQIDNDSDKIELDIRSVEDIYKCDTIGDDEDISPVVVTFQQRSSQKPVLRKSKRIIRTDSEIFDENIISGRNEIVLQANYDIQIHKEPTDCTATTPPSFSNERNRSSATSTSTNHDSRLESSDIDEICSPKDLMHKSTDESSRNMSTDELDTVFSDTTDLEQLERDYRELVRSNLQREYKSDGDSLDEVGKKRNDFLKWKNQSFENNFELYKENTARIPDDTPPETISVVCSPAESNQITSTTNSSETSSNRQQYDAQFANKLKGIASGKNSRVVSPTIVSVESCESVTKSSSSVRPSKLDISQEGSSDQKPAALSTSGSKDGTITSLFEKRFGKIKKINKLLKCKRFSTSALYDKKSSDSMEKPKFCVARSQPVPAVETPPPLQPTIIGLKDNPAISACKSIRSKFSPGRSNISESKSSIYSSKLSLFNNKSIFSIRKSPMFSNASHSNTELNIEPQSGLTKMNDVSKSNSELNKCKSSPSRFGSKRSIKGAVKVTSSNCLYKVPQPAHSPLSEEFYNKTGSVRLSAMELYEKFCSEDFGGLYKHETMHDGSCGGYKNWHEFRLGQRGLGVTQKYARAKNAKLLRQKSEPKFSFRDDTYFPEEDDEDIYEEEDPHDQDDYSHDQDEYSDHEEYEDDEEGDYYEDEELEEEEEEVGCIVGEPVTPVLTEETVAIDTARSGISKDDSAYHVPNRTAAVANDSDVDEIFLMPSGSKCTDDYEEYGFENKKFTLEQSMIMRANSTESGLDHIVDHFDGHKRKFSLSQEVREISDFGSDEILTIYKICSKDDMLSMGDAVIFKKTVRSASIADPEGPSSIERAVSAYVQNAAPDIEIEPSIYKTDCTSSMLMIRSESIELLSSSSGTLRSGSTLTEYAFDTVRNLQLDSCSTSKLSLSLKSEIFDDYTITPDDQPRMLQSCDFEDFTLTPDGSISESHNGKAEIVALEVDQSQAEQSITSNDMVVIVDKFLPNERRSDETLTNAFDEADQSEIIHSPSKDLEMKKHLMPKLTNCFSFDDTVCDQTRVNDEPQLSIVDLDEDDEEIPQKDVVSAFTTEITREFDLLFSRAQHDEVVTEVEEPIQVVPLCTSTGENSPSGADRRHQPPQRMPSRYSMQYLEPYVLTNEFGDNGVQLTTPVGERLCPSLAVVQYCKLAVLDDTTFATKRVANKLKKNRSQSLGNLSNKTRCFPL